MDNFLETYSSPKLNQEEIDNLNRPITRSKILEYVIKKTPTNKSPGPDGFTGEFYQTCKEELILILLKLFQKLKRREHSQRHSMKPPSPRYQNQTKKPPKKENHRPISLTNMDAKILNKILVNRIQQHKKDHTP